jgi:hypothetical protein
MEETHRQETQSATITRIMDNPAADMVFSRQSDLEANTSSPALPALTPPDVNETTPSLSSPPQCTKSRSGSPRGSTQETQPCNSNTSMLNALKWLIKSTPEPSAYRTSGAAIVEKVVAEEATNTASELIARTAETLTTTNEEIERDTVDQDTTAAPNDTPPDYSKPAETTVEPAATEIKTPKKTAGKKSQIPSKVVGKAPVAKSKPAPKKRKGKVSKPEPEPEKPLSEDEVKLARFSKLLQNLIATANALQDEFGGIPEQIQIVTDRFNHYHGKFSLTGFLL